MLRAWIEGEELRTDGEAQVGDTYPGICCAGHGWEVLMILFSVWGECSNPNCPEEVGSHYWRMSSHDVEDIALTLVGERQGHHGCANEVNQ